MGNMLFCENLNEALQLEKEAKVRAAVLLKEMPKYAQMPPGALGIVIRRKLYPFSGWAIEADLTWDGEIVRKYESFDLLELDLLHIQMAAIQRGREV